MNSILGEEAPDNWPKNGRRTDAFRPSAMGREETFTLSKKEKEEKKKEGKLSWEI